MGKEEVLFWGRGGSRHCDIEGVHAWRPPFFGEIGRNRIFYKRERTGDLRPVSVWNHCGKRERKLTKDGKRNAKRKEEFFQLPPSLLPLKTTPQDVFLSMLITMHWFTLCQNGKE